MTTEIHTTVRGGLPVIATGAVDDPGRDEYPGTRGVVDIEVYWLRRNGRRGALMDEKLWINDFDHLSEELLEEADREDDCDA